MRIGFAHRMTVRRNNLRRFLWSLAGLVLCVPAFGQTDPRVEISAGVGYLYGGYLWNSKTADAQVSVGEHLDYGVRAGWRASPHWEFEFDWTHVGTRLQFTPNAPPVPLDIDYFTPSVAYHFLTGCLRPYIAAGFGGGVFDIPQSGSSGGYFTGTLAVGLKAFLSPNFGARIEARAFASGVGDPPLGFPCTTIGSGGSSDPAEPASCAHEWIVNGDLTAGLVFAF